MGAMVPASCPEDAGTGLKGVVHMPALRGALS